MIPPRKIPTTLGLFAVKSIGGAAIAGFAVAHRTHLVD
jgi:hypothetical protein